MNDVENSTEYKTAKTAYYSGLIVAGAGIATWLGGSAICTIELNKYTNNNTSSGSAEEIYSLNQEAKKQPAYQRGEAMEIGGYVGMLAGIGAALWGRHKIALFYYDANNKRHELVIIGDKEYGAYRIMDLSMRVEYLCKTKQEKELLEELIQKIETN